MDVFFSALFGGTAKLYDDLTDNNIITDDFQLQVLKTLQIASLTAASIHDFALSVFFVFFHAACALASPKAYLSDNFYVTIIVLCPLLLIASFPYREPINLISILYLVSFLAGGAIEPYVTPEEYSYRKFIIRSISTVVLAVVLPFANWLGVSWSFIKIGVGCLAYMIVSSFFQLYMLRREKDTSPEVHA